MLTVLIGEALVIFIIIKFKSKRRTASDELIRASGLLIFTAFIWFSIALAIGNINPVYRQKEEWKTSLMGFNNNYQIGGNYFVAKGTVKGKTYFKFYNQFGQKQTLDSVAVVKIIQDTSNPYLVKVNNFPSSRSWWGIAFDPEESYEFHVPPGSVLDSLSFH